MRHMPELLCWLFHQACAEHAAFVAPKAAAVCDSYLQRVVSPLYAAVRERMKHDRLTYDDVNEFFWVRTQGLEPLTSQLG